MTEFLSVVLFWSILMALIGGAVLLVPKISAKIEKSQKNDEDENIQDIADE